MDLIKYQKFEVLLYSYNTLVAILSTLQIDINTLHVKGASEDESDVIYALVMGNRSIDNQIRSSNITDKTCRVAITYKHTVRNVYYNEIRRLTVECVEINSVLDKVEIALDLLPVDDKQLVRSIYFDGLRWSESGRAREKKGMLEKLTSVARISESEYENMLIKLGNKNRECD